MLLSGYSHNPGIAYILPASFRPYEIPPIAILWIRLSRAVFLFDRFVFPHGPQRLWLQVALV